MAVSYGPKLGLIINALTGDTYDVALRALLRSLDQLQFLHVKSRIVTAPPGSPANGDAYIVGPSATGAWAGHDKSIAVWTTDNPATPGGLWEFHVPNAGWLAYSDADTGFYSYSGTAWGALTGGGGSTTFIGLTDVPASFAGAGGKLVKVNAGATALEFDAGGGGVTNFTDLGDVPSSYSGAGGKTVKVNAGATGLEFDAGGGGGGVAAGTPVMGMGNSAQAVALGPLGAGNTMVLKIPGRNLNCLPTSWKVRIMRGSGSHFSAIVILRTLVDSLVVVDSTPVTFASSATPTLTGLSLSDAVSLALDVDHDYWLMGYNDSGDSSFWGLKPNQGVGALGASIVGGYVPGDQTAVSPVDVGSMGTGFGAPWDAVLAA